MKKKFTLVLALCACLTLGAGLVACETEEPVDSVSTPAASSPADSTPEKPETPELPLTKAQWEALFTLDNVTVTINSVYEGQNIPIQKFLFANNKCALDMEGMLIPMDDAEQYRSMFDVSNAYDKVQYKDGKFYLASHNPFGTGDMYYENLYVTVADGKIVSVAANMVEVADDGTKTSDPAYIEFTNYGTTVIPEKNLPITEEQWRTAFNGNLFSNVTTTATFTLDEIGDVTETLYYANGMERVTVDFLDLETEAVAELYCVNDAWYLYYFADGSIQAIDDFWGVDPELQEEVSMYLQFTTISGMIKSFITQGAEMYAIMEYDETTQEYWYGGVDMEVQLRFSIENGVLTGYKVIMYSEDDLGAITESVYHYTFSDQGTTEFEVPFSVPEKSE